MLSLGLGTRIMRKYGAGLRNGNLKKWGRIRQLTGDWSKNWHINCVKIRRWLQANCDFSLAVKGLGEKQKNLKSLKYWSKPLPWDHVLRWLLDLNSLRKTCRLFTVAIHSQHSASSDKAWQNSVLTRWCMRPLICFFSPLLHSTGTELP